MAASHPVTFPSPDTAFPIVPPDGTRHAGTVFLRAVVSHPRMAIGEYTYASSFDPPTDWAARLAQHLHSFAPERLVIGKFCQIAHGALFITSSANHRHDGFSSFPFAIFDDKARDDRPSMPPAGPDTIIGNDVWIGQGAMILPGTTIGDGVIVGAGAVVAGVVPDYAMIAGNRARVRKMRFDGTTFKRLKAIAWWNWPVAAIWKHEAEIVGADIDALELAFRNLPGS